MTNKLELKLEGEFEVKSGELLIIDPCCLSNLKELGYSYVREQIETEYDSFFELIKEETEINIEAEKALEKYCKLHEYIEKGDKEAIIEIASAREILHSSVVKRNKLKERGEELAKQPKLTPPYIAQTDNLLAYSNSIGDGIYPVIKNQNIIKVIFNFPIKHAGDGKGFVTNEDRLEGKLLGHSVVDSGMQMLIDSSKVRIRKEVYPHAFCKVNLSNGVYSAKFTDDNDRLSIRKKG